MNEYACNINLRHILYKIIVKRSKLILLLFRVNVYLLGA